MSARITGGCGDCHTPTDAQGSPDPAKLLAGGGFSIKDKDGRVVTPDQATGPGEWSDAEIAAAIREGKRRGGGQLNPFMRIIRQHGQNRFDVSLSLCD